MRDPLAAWRAWTGVLLGVALAARLPLMMRRHFDADELQHLHAAYSIWIGMVPHLDFFDHHTPWIHYGLAALFPLTGASVATLFAARWLMLAVTLAILYLTYHVGRRAYGVEAGLLSAVLLAYAPMFVQKSLEARPDVPAVACWLAAVALLVGAAPRGAPTRSFWSGLAAGCAVMFTPKMLFGVAGLAAALAWHTTRPRRDPAVDLVRGAGSFAAGFVLPIALTLAWFQWSGALGPLVHETLVMNARWQGRFSPHRYGAELLRQTPFLVLLGILGWLVAVRQLSRGDESQPGHPVLMMSMAGVIAGLYIIPVPHRQSFLPLLPLLAIFGGGILWRGAQRLSPPAWIVPAAVAAMAGTYLLNAVPARAGAIGVLGLALAALATVCRGRPLVLAAVVSVLLVPALERSLAAPRTSNDAQLREIRYVLDRTSPDDTILTGWRLTGLFRPHAYYFFFPHGEVRAMMSDRQRGPDVVRALDEKRPTLVENDASVQALAPEVGAYIDRHYEPTGVGVLFRRRE